MPRCALIFIPASVLFLDQLTKNLVIMFLGSWGVFYEVIGGFFNLISVWNKGVSFGLLGSIENANLILGLLVSAIIVLLTVLMIKVESFRDKLCLSLVIVGSIGNLIDRVRFGAVFDFIDLHYGDWHWPAFNLADFSIFCGFSLLFVYSAGSNGAVLRGNFGKHLSLFVILLVLSISSSSCSLTRKNISEKGTLIEPPFDFHIDDRR